MKLFRPFTAIMAATMLLTAGLDASAAAPKRKAGTRKTGTTATTTKTKSTAAKTVVKPLTAEMVEGKSYATYIYFSEEEGERYYIFAVADLKADGVVDYKLTSSMNADGEWNVQNDKLSFTVGKFSFTGTSSNGGTSLQGTLNGVDLSYSNAVITLTGENTETVDANKVLPDLVAGKYTSMAGFVADGTTICMNASTTFKDTPKKSWKVTGNSKIFTAMGLLKGSYTVQDGKLVLTLTDGKTVDCEIKGNGNFIEIKPGKMRIEGYGNLPIRIFLMKKP